MQLVRQGYSVIDAVSDPRIGVSFSAYRQWRARFPQWAAEVDVARATMYRPFKHKMQLDEMTSAQFAMRYFGVARTWFQQRWIDEVQTMRKGDILLTLWPPEYGKTSTFEDYATEQVARNNEWRSTVVSENDEISKKILSAVRSRLEPDGPTPQIVKEWGPFRQTGGDANRSQIWNAKSFTIMQAKTQMARDFTMLAIGWKSSVVSVRTDHLHIDDMTSTKSFEQTPKMLKTFRQDLLSRPGERGITTISGTIVDDEDFYAQLLDDDELIESGILHILKFPAIQFDLQGNPYPLWPYRHTLEQLERIRIKIKDKAFDRTYMMQPGRSDKTKYAFDEEGWARAKVPNLTLNQTGLWVPGEAKPVGVLSLDPGLSPGVCCLGGWEMTEDYMRLRFFQESDEYARNEQIIAALSGAARFMVQDTRLMHCVVEAKNFQRGLARDERLELVCQNFGFTIGEHDTGMNKYDASIGIASMASDWRAGKIQLPYNEDDPITVEEMGEFWRQFKKWKPDAKTGLVGRGNKIRYDRLMMTWFGWIWWVNNRHRLGPPPPPIKRVGLPYSMTPARRIMPMGAQWK